MLPDPNNTADHSPSVPVRVARFLPALLVFAGAVVLTDPLVLIILLIGAALMMTAVCSGIGFAMDGRFARSIARRGLACLLALTLFTVFIATLLAVPTWWLLREPSLTAALALSAAIVLGVLSLWRIWPVFVLPLVWDDAYPEVTEGSWLATALRRSLAFARHLTGEHELFFSHGLPSALFVLIICMGALALAAFGDRLGIELRVAVIAVYALVLLPLACLLMLTRCVNAIFADVRSQRSRRKREASLFVEPVETIEPRTDEIDSVAMTSPDATLLAAARSGQIDLALAALDVGANPNLVPPEGERDQRSVLVHAVILPDLRLLRNLIEKGVDVNRVHAGLPPLIAATRDSFQGRPDAIMTLLANGAQPTITDGSGNTALHHAALCGEPVVAALLIDAGVPLDAINRDGMTALGMACSNGNWTLATFLLDRGAATTVEHAEPALLLAAGVADDDQSGVKLLLKRKAAVNACGRLDRSALMMAALHGHQAIAECLLGAGAEADLTDRNGTTALMEAARSGAVSIIQLLGRRQVAVDRIDTLGRSALSIACGSRTANEDVVHALLGLGANPRLCANDGRRPVDLAIASGRWPIVALLDPDYVLPSSIDAQPPTAVEVDLAHLLDALRFGHWDVAEEMRDAIPARPKAELAQLYLGLVEPQYERARNWVCNLGLSADDRLDNGQSLGDVLLSDLAENAQALLQLVSRGSALGGAGIVARLLAQAPTGGNNSSIVELATALFQRGADWLACDAGDITAVHLACALGEDQLLDALLSCGADPNARDARGLMPLHCALKASASRAIAVSRVLIRHGADPELASESGETPLGLALSRAQRELVYWLNWPRWKLPGRALQGKDMPAAAASGDIDAVNKLLALGLAVDSVDQQGANALIRAAGSGYAGLVVRLLDVGADPKQASWSGATCLSAAVAGRREAVVRTLLQQGIDADQRLPGGGTPLMIAAALGLPRLAEPLLERGADPNAADDRGNTALQAAALFAFDSRDTAVAAELLDLLIRHGARIDMRNQGEQDALLLLLGVRAEPGSPCDAQHLAHLAGLLIGKGASVDGRDQRGISPLHACAMHGLLGVAKLLRSHDAPVDQQDSLGRTAGEVAALLGYTDVASELGVIRNAAPSARLTLRKRVTD